MRSRILKFALAAVAALPLIAGPVEAAEKGTITGEVLRGDSDRGVRGVRVVLTQASEQGSEPKVKRTTTDRRGRFEFDKLPTGDEYLYTLTANFRQGYYGGAVRLPSDTAEPPVVDTTLRVWPPTDDPDVIVVERDAMFLSLSDRGVDVIESVIVINNSNRAYIGRGGGGDEGPRPTLGFSVPDGAELPDFPLVDSSIDVPGATESDFGLAITAAVPPGESTFTYTYTIPGSAGIFDINRAALYPTLNMLVHAEPPLTIRSNRLVPDERVRIGDRTYERWATTDTIEGGDRLQVQATAEAEGGGLNIGIGIAAVLAVGLVGFAFMRRRGPRPVEGLTAYGGHPVAETRDHLLSLIAALDLRYRAGDISEQEWSKRRAELKERLANLAQPEPTL
ncbi:MAG TPA: hypothetical protein VFA00_07735 [Actinomycetota bacterium]|nr:hypothetical protein [Actinomycetota bacterium]